MLRFFLFWCLCVPAFAALPILSMAQGRDVSNSEAETETEVLFATFSLVGDSTRTPFILQITFENCSELKDVYGETLPLTVIDLKYYKTKSQVWEKINLRPGKNLRQNKNNMKPSKDLKLGKRMHNCIHNIEFYNDVQEKYNMEIWASWNKQRAPGGTFYGNASFNILPKP